MSLSHSIRIFETEIPLAIIIVIFIGLYGILFGILRSKRVIQQRPSEPNDHSTLLNSDETAPLKRDASKSDKPLSHQAPDQRNTHSREEKMVARSRHKQALGRESKSTKKIVKMDFNKAAVSTDSRQDSDSGPTSEN